MSLSRLVRTLVEGNDSGKVYWVKVTSKYEGLPQDQWEFVFQKSKKVVDEVCFKAGRVDTIAQVAL